MGGGGNETGLGPGTLWGSAVCTWTYQGEPSGSGYSFSNTPLPPISPSLCTHLKSETISVNCFLSLTSLYDSKQSCLSICGSQPGVVGFHLHGTCLAPWPDLEPTAWIIHSVAPAVAFQCPREAKLTHPVCLCMSVPSVWKALLLRLYAVALPLRLYLCQITCRDILSKVDPTYSQT